jgi:hypothetical protein
VIFCRNVLIYFSDSLTILRAVQQFYELLAPGDTSSSATRVVVAGHGHLHAHPFPGDGLSESGEP